MTTDTGYFAVLDSFFMDWLICDDYTWTNIEKKNVILTDLQMYQEWARKKKNARYTLSLNKIVL